MNDQTRKYRNELFCQKTADFYQQSLLELADYDQQVDQGVDPVELNQILDRFEERLAEFYDSAFLLTAKELKNMMEAGLSLSDYLKIREDLENDYNVNQATLEFFNLIDQRKHYRADYKGSLENNSAGIDFVGKEFQLPEFWEIIKAMTADQLRLYQRMVKDGMAPQLQVTPIAYKVQTLVDKFSLKKDLFLDEQNKPVLREIRYTQFAQDFDLLYGENIQTGVNTLAIDSGGKHKSQWIEAEGGCQVNIVATKPWIHPDVQKVWQEKEGSFSFGELMARSRKKFLEIGFCGLTLETDLIALMNENRLGTHASRHTRQMLLDVMKPSADSAPSCARTWMDIMMDGSILSSGHDTMWVRPAIRVRLKS